MALAARVAAGVDSAAPAAVRRSTLNADRELRRVFGDQTINAADSNRPLALLHYYTGELTPSGGASTAAAAAVGKLRRKRHSLLVSPRNGAAAAADRERR